MPGLEKGLWQNHLRDSAASADYQQLRKYACQAAKKYFSDPESLKQACRLLTQFYLGAATHWETLRKRNLIPAGVAFPHIVIDDYPGYGFLYDSSLHALAIDRSFLEKSVAFGDADAVGDWGDIFGNKPKRMSGSMVFFLKGVHELDHAVKTYRYHNVEVSNHRQSAQRYHAPNKEYLALGWEIYYAKKYGLPSTLIAQYESVLQRVIDFRKKAGLRLKQKTR